MYEDLNKDPAILIDAQIIQSSLCFSPAATTIITSHIEAPDSELNLSPLLTFTPEVLSFKADRKKANS